ncbi:hypothetical protein NUACC21_11430 [Scytonema sp. NUACC21]
MLFKLFTSTFITIYSIIPYGIAATEAVKIIIVDRLANVQSIAYQEVVCSLDNSDRIEARQLSQLKGVVSEVTFRFDETVVNKLQSQNQQSMLTLSNCKKPCKTEI